MSGLQIVAVAYLIWVALGLIAVLVYIRSKTK